MSDHNITTSRRKYYLTLALVLILVTAGTFLIIFLALTLFSNNDISNGGG